MATHEEFEVRTNTGIQSKVYKLELGNTVVHVFEHGAINTLHHNGQDVTAQKSLEIMLKHFTELAGQRGGNPFMGPMAGRYDSSRVAQPGAVDIHGVFAGMSWELSQISDGGDFIEMQLRAEVWKERLKEYYYFAALQAGPMGKRSLYRLIQATITRFPEDGDLIRNLNEFWKLANTTNPDQSDVDSLAKYLVDRAYPGQANIVRQITIEQLDGAVSFLDEVTINNVSGKAGDNYLGAEGFHTYYNTLLNDIVVGDNYWGNNPPDFFDGDLDEVEIREVDQTNSELNRRVFVIPLHGVMHQIFYKDDQTIGLPDTAIENWRYPGNEAYYPNIARIVKPGEIASIAMRTIVTEGKTVAKSVQRILRDAAIKAGKIEG